MFRKIFYFIFKMIACQKIKRLFKSAQMQGVQKPGREAYRVYVERRGLRHNAAGECSRALLGISAADTLVVV